VTALVGRWTLDLGFVRLALRQAEEADLWSRIAVLPDIERRPRALAMREEVAAWHEERSGHLHEQPPDMVRFLARHAQLSTRLALLSSAAGERAN
jgi:hypothetical protein